MYRFLIAFLFFSVNTNQGYAEETTLSSLREAAAKFALDLLKESGPKNVFFSPASISTCLGMVYAGAKGETKDEINKEVYGSLPDSKIYDGIKHFINDTSNLPSGYSVSVANRVYTFGGKLLDEFKDKLNDTFKSDLVQLTTGPDESVKTINSWVKTQTKDKISELLPKGSIDTDTEIVLVNAIYFKGDWLKTFNKTFTKEEKFNSDENQNFKVQMMSALDKFYYSEDDNVKLLGIPFKNDTVVMYFLLPRTRFGLKDVEKNLTARSLIDMFEKANSGSKVRAIIPKFKFTKELPLMDIMKKLNVTKVFDTKADLSGMFGKNNLHVSGAFHKAAVDVNEEGSEAAAATGVVGKSRTMLSVPTFFADEPFLFTIVHKATKSILFLGRFADNNFA